MVSVVPSCVVDGVVEQRLVEQGGPVDAECRPWLWWAEGVEAGVAGQRQLDHPRRERAPGGVLGPLHGDPEQLGARVLAVGILLGLSDAVDRDRVDTVDGVGVAVDGSLDELGLGVEVGACEREDHAVLPSARPR